MQLLLKPALPSYIIYFSRSPDSLNLTGFLPRALGGSEIRLFQVINNKEVPRRKPLVTSEGLLYKPHNNLSPLISLLGQSNVAARYNSTESNYANCPVYQTLNEKNPGTPVYQLPEYQSNGQPTNFSNEIQLETPKARTSPIAQEDQPTYQGLLNENSEFMSMIIASCVSCH